MVLPYFTLFRKNPINRLSLIAQKTWLNRSIVVIMPFVYQGLKITFGSKDWNFSHNALQETVEITSEKLAGRSY